MFAFQNDEQCHWEYDWNSGTSQRQRARTHVFRAYALLPVAATVQVTATTRKTKPRVKKKTNAAASKNAMTWQVVGVATSTPFTISAYRKPTEPEQHTSTTVRTQRHEVIGVDVDNDSDETETDPEPEDLSEIIAASLLLLPPDFRKLLWEKRNPAVVKATTSLSIFALFVSQIQLKWLSPYTLSRSLLPLLRFWRNPDPVQPAMTQDFYGYASVSSGDHRSTGGSDQERLLLHYVNYCAPRLVTVLTANTTTDTRHGHSYSGQYEASSNGEDDESSDRDESMAQLSYLAEQCFDLVCSLLENDQWSLIERFVRQEANSSEASSGENESEDSSKGGETVYARFVSLLTHLLNETLANDAMKLGLLVDNIVSSIYKDWKSSEPASFAPFISEQIESLLRNTNVLGFELFQAQVQVVESSQEDQVFGYAHSLLGFPSPPSDFNGRWVCRAIESSQRHSIPNHVMQASDFHAVPVILTLLRTFGFDLELQEGSGHGEGSVARLSVHSLVSLFPEVGTCFALDNEFHSLDHLSCGMNVEWLLKLVLAGEPSTSSAESCIEYRGSMAPSKSNGIVHLGVYLHSSVGDGVRVSFEIQLLQLRHQALSSHATRTRLQVEVTLARGNCDREDVGGGSVTPHERLERIEKWHEQLVFTATYDRHFSGSPVESDDRMARTRAPTAFTISRDDEGSGELSAVV